MFTDVELDYLASQRLGRLATAQPNGTLQVNPVGFRYNSRTGTIDIGGLRMAASRKFRNVAGNGQVAFVVDDLASIQPWRGTVPGDPRARRGDHQARPFRLRRRHRRVRRGDHPHPSRAHYQLRYRRPRSRRPPARDQRPRRGLTPATAVPARSHGRPFPRRTMRIWPISGIKPGHSPC
jgi:PPOX class F420-dependent enzyme/OxyR family protein